VESSEFVVRRFSLQPERKSFELSPFGSTMGRLLRKKLTSKKKKNDAVQVSRSKGDDVAENTSPSSPAVVKPVAKKPAFTAKAQPTKIKKDKNFIEKSAQFLREVKVELKKVTWPSRKQTLGSTAVVIVLVMIISMFLGVVDIGLSSLFRAVLQL
jgi:preprotein translocase subunit SecE